MPEVPLIPAVDRGAGDQSTFRFPLDSGLCLIPIQRKVFITPNRVNYQCIVDESDRALLGLSFIHRNPQSLQLLSSRSIHLLQGPRFLPVALIFRPLPPLLIFGDSCNLPVAPLPRNTVKGVLRGFLHAVPHQLHPGWASLFHVFQLPPPSDARPPTPLGLL